MDINNQIAGIMAKALNNEASAEEMLLLNDYLATHPDEAGRYEMLGKIWSSTPGLPIANSIGNGRKDVERLNRLQARAAMERQLTEQAAQEPMEMPEALPIKRFSLYNIMKYAAAVAIIVSCAAIYFAMQPAAKNTADNMQIVVAENGSRKRVMLPDGSTVLLNSGSRLHYCTDFMGKTRDVTLYGEAFFDVVKNPAKPFVVHSGTIDIKVLGTAFNVKSYPDDSAVETTLIRGLVEIHSKENATGKPIYLHPNEKVTLAREPKTANPKVLQSTADYTEGKVITLDTAAKEKQWVETAWIYNRLEFRKNTFDEIAKKLERWYDVKINIENDQLAQQTFNGSFENETLEQALKALQKTTPFYFKINNNDVLIDVSE